MEIGLVHYLTVSAVLFGLGLFTVMTRKNAVGILLVVNAGTVGRWRAHGWQGEVG